MNKPQQQEKMIRRFMMNTHGLAEEVDSHTRSCTISVKKIQAGGYAYIYKLKLCRAARANLPWPSPSKGEAN
jgi:hypothetical protein